MTPPGTELVLSQDAWLRRLARRLVRDPDLADDLAQDAWLAGLERDRTDVTSRGWLAGVLRNRGRATYRAESRRRARERSAAASEAIEATDDVVAQLQLRKRALDELLALEEPYRTALYRAFVEDESVREIARGTGVGRSTANDRIQEGLGRLRTRLDRAYGGERRAWASILLPLGRPTGAAALSFGGLSMLAIGTILVGGVAVALSTLGSRGEPEPVPEELTRVEAGTIGAPPSPRAAEPRLADPARTSARVAGAVAMISTVEGPSPARQFEGGVSAVVLLPNEAPAVGATWTLEVPEGTGRRGVPEDWTDPTGTIGADGRLDARFDPPRGVRFTLTIELDGYAREQARWQELPGDRVEQLGTITLHEGGSVAGRVVDSTGAPILGTAWNVRASEIGDRPTLPREPRMGSTKADETTAEFRIDALPAGAVEIHVFDERFGYSAKKFITIPSGGTLAHDIVLVEAEGIADAVMVRLIEHSGPDGIGQVDAERVWLVSPDGTRRHARREQSRSWCYIFDDVGPGSFRIEVDDPMYDPWSKDDVTAGAYVRTLLWPSAAIQLDVVSATGLSVTDYDARLIVERPGQTPWTRTNWIKFPGAPEGLLDGVLPHDYVLVLSSEAGTARVAVDGLQPGETRTVEVVLEENALVRGAVVRPDGSPAKGVLVRLVQPAAVGDSPASFVVGRGVSTNETDRVRVERSRTTTDASGGFELVLEEEGLHLVVVGGRPSGLRGQEGPRAECEAFDRSGAPQDLRFELPRGGRVEGRLRFPAGFPVGSRRVGFLPTGAASPRDVVVASLGTDGGFTIGPIDAGPGRLYLLTARGYSLRGGALVPGDLLGGIEIVEGETSAVEYDAPVGEPARITLQLSPSIPSGASAQVSLVRTDHSKSRTTETGSGSSFGPFVVEAGTYDVWMCGDDWTAVHQGVVLAEDEQRTETIEVALESRDVRFTVDGAAVPGTTIQIDGAVFHPRTDAQGIATLRLGPGSYFVSCSHGEPGADPGFYMATIEWPLAAGVDEITLAGFGD